MRPPKSKRSTRNQTIALTDAEASKYKKKLIRLEEIAKLSAVKNKIVYGDFVEVAQMLPKKQFDLLFADPPYNIRKTFGKSTFKQKSLEDYERWLESWIQKSIPLLAPTASIYICGDWRSAAAIQRVGMKYFKLRNRITWEREKGRGAKANWKNSSEDIWFFTVSDDYTFNAAEVKIKRKVLAPYRKNGVPKDWNENKKEGNFRMTAASNIWSDMTVPFWSMPENTDHPTQKPEKLLAKLILASTNQNDLILDPFLGSGTSAVVAKKLRRSFVGVEIDETYCMLAEKRLELAKENDRIQGFVDGVFLERNTEIDRTRRGKE